MQCVMTTNISVVTEIIGSEDLPLLVVGSNMLPKLVTVSVSFASFTQLLLKLVVAGTTTKIDNLPNW